MVTDDKALAEVRYARRAAGAAEGQHPRRDGHAQRRRDPRGGRPTQRRPDPLAAPVLGRPEAAAAARSASCGRARRSLAKVPAAIGRPLGPRVRGRGRHPAGAAVKLATTCCSAARSRRWAKVSRSAQVRRRAAYVYDDDGRPVRGAGVQGLWQHHREVTPSARRLQRAGAQGRQSFAGRRWRPTCRCRAACLATGWSARSRTA